LRYMTVVSGCLAPSEHHRREAIYRHSPQPGCLILLGILRGGNPSLALAGGGTLEWRRGRKDLWRDAIITLVTWDVPRLFPVSARVILTHRPNVPRYSRPRRRGQRGAAGARRDDETARADDGPRGAPGAQGLFPAPNAR
jgi:hypothetical protein